MPNHRIPARRGFTLIELLVVIGIIGLMLGITMTAFEGLGQGAKMRSATMEIKTALALARQHAVAQRVNTFVVFPHAANPYLPDLDFSEDPKLRTSPYQAYCICATNGSVEMYEWRFLPKGVVFLAPTGGQPPFTVVGTDNVFTPAISGSVSNNCYNIQFPTTNAPNQRVFAIGFNGLGRLIQTGGTTPEVFITEGSVDINPGSGSLVSYILKAASTTNGLAVRPLTGQVKVREY